MHTSPFEQVAQLTVKKDAVNVGIGAAIGTAISGTGGAASAGQVLMTGGEAAELGVETRLSFRLQEAVTLTEKLNN